MIGDKKDKAIVKETGEIQEVNSTYMVKHITMSFNFELDEDQKKTFKEMTFIHDSEPQEEGNYYTLEDNRTYHEKDLIVGMDKIRDQKLNDII